MVFDTTFSFELPTLYFKSGQFLWRTLEFSSHCLLLPIGKTSEPLLCMLAGGILGFLAFALLM